LFTGLIEELGIVKSLTRGTVNRLTVASARVAANACVGDSIAVNGVCLTVTSVYGDELAFDAVSETLSRSTLGSLRSGDRVNLESSLKAGSAIGGHFVQGHVDGVGIVDSIRRIEDSAIVRICAPPEVMKYVVEKGSIAVDGISLTVASVDGSSFTVAVIPHTLEVTTLGLKRPGDKVNLEADIIGKYVEKFLTNRPVDGITEDLLRRAGFV
jgi:riboflavin synthase